MRKSQENRPEGAARNSEVVREERCPQPGSARLSCHQAERCSKGCWDAEELDHDVTSCWRTRIASQPLFPRETRVGSLRTRQDHVCCARLRGGGWRQADLDALVSHELLTPAPMLSSTPISPEQRCRTHPERMQKHAHLARLRSSAPIPLTLVTQGTGATTADARCIDHAQAPVGLSTLLMGTKLLVRWTAQRPSWLESEIVT